MVFVPICWPSPGIATFTVKADVTYTSLPFWPLQMLHLRVQLGGRVLLPSKFVEAMRKQNGIPNDLLKLHVSWGWFIKIHVHQSFSSRPRLWLQFYPREWLHHRDGMRSQDFLRNAIGWQAESTQPSTINVNYVADHLFSCYDRSLNGVSWLQNLKLGQAFGWRAGAPVDDQRSRWSNGDQLGSPQSRPQQRAPDFGLYQARRTHRHLGLNQASNVQSLKNKMHLITWIP